MKFTLPQNAFLQPLRHLQRIAVSSGTLPILSHVRMAAHNDRIEFAATDMDLYVIERLSGEVLREGSAMVPAKVFHNIVSKIPKDETIDLWLRNPDEPGLEVGEEGHSSPPEANAFRQGLTGEKPADPGEASPLLLETGVEQVVLSAGSSRFVLNTLSPDDFPVFADEGYQGRFSIPGSDLLRLIRRTRFAMSSDDTRTHLNGIYLHTTEGPERYLRSAATDGHRLAQVAVELPEGAEGMKGLLLPHKTVEEIASLLEHHDREVTIEYEPTRVRMMFEGVTLVSRLLDGTFPDYARVIPTGNDRFLTVPRRNFQLAVERVSTVADDQKSLRFDIGAEEVVISVRTNVGGARETVEARYEGPKMAVGFNSDYLNDICRVLDGQDLRLELGSEAEAVVVRDSDDEGALFVVMPLRV